MGKGGQAPLLPAGDGPRYKELLSSGYFFERPHNSTNNKCSHFLGLQKVTTVA